MLLLLLDLLLLALAGKRGGQFQIAPRGEVEAEIGAFELHGQRPQMRQFPGLRGLRVLQQRTGGDQRPARDREAGPAQHACILDRADDAEQALALLKRFGSVTVLNGHIHQVLRKVEGNVTFHTAYSTSFPQPAPGAAAWRSFRAAGPRG